MTLAQRIKILRKHLGLSQTQFAGDIGITQTSLSQIEGEKNGISYDVYKAIIEKFMVDPLWLMDGKGQMFRDEKAAHKPGSALPLVVAVADDGDENIVLVNQKAAAGYLKGQHDPDFIAKLPSFRLPGFHGKTFRAFEISGNSMQPGISPGDMLIGEYEESPAQVKKNHVYIVVTNDGSIVAKRIHPLPNHHFELRSDNKEYQPYEVKNSEIVQLWRVQARITKELPAPAETGSDRLSTLEERLIELEKKMK